MYMWKDCGLWPAHGLEVLQMMSLIKIGKGNVMWMHDDLKDLGREIAFQGSGGELAQNRRLWNHKDALAVLSRKEVNTGSDQ